MINDTPKRLNYNDRLNSMLAEFDDLDDTCADLLPNEQAGRFHKLAIEFRAFVETTRHNHD